jgi:predicted mannosyl-3-phosphoglycerate phosphatase (HAD superfamily)
VLCREVRVIEVDKWVIRLNEMRLKFPMGGRAYLVTSVCWGNGKSTLSRQGMMGFISL